MPVIQESKPFKNYDKFVVDRYSNKIQDIKDFVGKNWKGNQPFDYTFLNSVADQISKYNCVSVRQMEVIDNMAKKLNIEDFV